MHFPHHYGLFLRHSLHPLQWFFSRRDERHVPQFIPPGIKIFCFFDV
jgi:hypothetical protein